MMINKTFMKVLLLSLFTSLSCEHTETGQMEITSPVEEELEPVNLLLNPKDACSDFSFRIFRAAINEDTESNIFISPLSVSTALSMTLNGAAGITREEMLSTLGLSGNDLTEINDSYKSTLDIILSSDPSVTLENANSLWFDQGMNVMEEFLNINQSCYDAGVFSLDLSDPSARETINQWVYDKTNGKIEDMLTDEIDPTTVMILLNAIYFNASWTYGFEPESTVDGSFYLMDGSEYTCKMMWRKGKVGYSRHGDLRAVDMPYGTGKFSMTILYSRYISELDDFISDLDLNLWSTLTDSLTELDSTYVGLPKFKIEYENSLKEILKSMNMIQAFGGTADFSNITGDHGLFIKDVLHKTFIDVNESGSEAAAATAVLGARGGPPTIAINHPFVFAIRENESDTIIFMGKVLRPEYND